MNLNKIKNFLKKYSVYIFIILVFLITIVIYSILPTEISSKVFFTIFFISIILRIVVEILSRANQITIPIDNKTNTIKKVYELFDLESTRTIVAINTKDEKVLTRAKKLFPGSRENKRKDLYSILLPTVTLKTLVLFLKDNEPERIIIHQFNKALENKPQSVGRSLSICIDNKLIIQYSKNTFTKEEIKNIKEQLLKK